MAHPDLRLEAFPPGFMWGVSTSAYQIEGAASEDGRAPSIWDVFSHTPGRIRDGETGDHAVDHYHRHTEDVALMGWLGVDAYRFSISWPRVLPEGVGEPNESGLGFYRRLCEELHEAGITPVVTLYHWDLPQALAERGGWLNPDSPHWFAEYAAFVKERLGDLVRIWTTLNEPWCAAFLGYSAGIHAPGLCDPAAAYVVAHRLMVAHHRATAILRETTPHPDDRIGVVLNLIPAWPAGDDDRDAEAAARVDLIQNRLFLEAVLSGRYPHEMGEIHARYQVGEVTDPDELAEVYSPADFLGINYYNVNRIAYRPGAPSPPEWPGADGAVLVPPPGATTEMGWGIDPEGLTWMLERVHREYPNIPLFILENGAAFPDPGPVEGRIDDAERIDYLRGHIGATAQAITRGVDVRGYFVWSLLDNFEWSHGYTKRFGLVHVDRTTMTRIPKASAHWYRDLIARVRGNTGQGE